MFNFYSFNGLHILTDQEMRKTPLLQVMTGRLAPLIAPLIRRKLGSRTFADHAWLINSDPKIIKADE